MCFSATASFVAAGAIGAVGAATLALRPEPRRLAFALIPSFFAAQQAVEGFIWLAMNKDGAAPAGLTIAYLFFAQIFWPAYTPFAVLAMERDQRRRWALWILLAGGLTVSGALGFILFNHHYTVQVVRHSLSYTSNHLFETRLVGLYVLATIAPLLISRHRYVLAFGATVLLGSIVTQIAFHYAAASVWCYFAAVASVFVFLHIRRRSRSNAR